MDGWIARGYRLSLESSNHAPICKLIWRSTGDDNVPY